VFALVSASVHRGVALLWVRVLLLAKREKKKAIPVGMTFSFLARRTEKDIGLFSMIFQIIYKIHETRIIS